MKKKELILAVLNQLRPYSMPYLMKRYGNKIEDGGYALLKNFTEESQIIYSLGVGAIVQNYLFEIEMASYGKKVFMYDDNLEKLPQHFENLFYKKCFVSSENAFEHIKENGHEDEIDMLAQIDIEGAEYELISNIDSSYFKHFSQLTFEFHDLHDPTEEMLNVFKKINKHYYMYHIHANNHANKFDSVFGVIPEAIEVSYIRKDKIPFTPYYCKLPRPFPLIDVPCYRFKPDITLSWWCS